MPFDFVDWDETVYDSRIRQRVPADSKGLTVIYKVYTVGYIETICGVNYAQVKPYICRKCQLELDAELNRRVALVRKRRAKETSTRRYESTWRLPRPGEFPVEAGTRQFALVSPALSFRNIEFQRRTSRLRCRGSSPAFVMLLTVDRVFSGRCCRTYEAITGRGEEAIESEEYWAVFLLTRWIQKNFQTDLRAIDPAFVWDANGPSGCYCQTERGPRLVQTNWIDGSVFSALDGFYEFSEVSTFMEGIGYRLIEQQERKSRGNR